MAEGPFIPDDFPKKEGEKSLQTPPVAAEVMHTRSGGVVDLNYERSKREILEGETSIAEQDLSQEPVVTLKSLHKGDVFTNNGGKSLVIERLRKDGNTTIVLFTEELEPGVRKNPEALIQQKPFKNFEVQRKTGGYMEWKTVYEQEFDKIFEECQRAFERFAEEMQSNDGKNVGYSSEAFDLGEQIGQISQEVGVIDDQWVASGLTLDETGVERKRALLDELKKTIATLPEQFTEAYPLLAKVQNKWRDSEAKKRTKVDVKPQLEENENNDLVVNEKKKLVKKGQKEKGVEGNKRKSRGDVRKERDADALEVEVTNQLVEPERRPRLSTQERDLNDRLVKYRQNLAWWEGAWPDDESHKLSEWTGAVREVQRELNEVADEIDKLYGRRRWERAMWRLGEGYREFALKKNGTQIEKRLDEIEHGGYDEYDSKIRTELRSYLFSYLQILGTGVRVIDKVRREQRTKGRSSRAGARRKGQEESQKGQSGTELATVATFERGLAEVLPDAHPRVRGAVAQGLIKVQQAFLESVRRAFEQEGIRPESLDLDELQEVLKRDMGVSFREQVIPMLLNRAKLPNSPEVVDGTFNLLIGGALPALQSPEDTPLGITYDNR